MFDTATMSDTLTKIVFSRLKETVSIQDNIIKIVLQVRVSEIVAVSYSRMIGTTRMLSSTRAESFNRIM